MDDIASPPAPVRHLAISGASVVSSKKKRTHTPGTRNVRIYVQFLARFIFPCCTFWLHSDTLRRRVMGVKERKEILNQLEGVRTSRVLCCVTSDREGANGVIGKVWRLFSTLPKPTGASANQVSQARSRRLHRKFIPLCSGIRVQAKESATCAKRKGQVTECA